MVSASSGTHPIVQQDAIKPVNAEVQPGTCPDTDTIAEAGLEPDVIVLPPSTSRELALIKPSKAPRRVSIVKARRLSRLHETFAVSLALGGLLAGYFAWRLSVGTISIAAASPLVEDALERIVGGEAKIGSLRLGWDPQRREFVVTANDITATTDARTSPLTLGQVDLTLDARALLAGRAQITKANLSGLQAVLVLDKLGRTAFGFGTIEEVLKLPLTKRKSKGLRSLLDSVRTAVLPNGENGRVEAIALRNAKLIIVDPDTGERLTLSDARANVTTNADKIVTMQAAGFATEMGGFANVAVSASPDETQRLVLAANVDKARLSKLPSSLRVGPLARFGADTTPISGKILVQLGDATNAFDVKSDLELGQGQFQGLALTRASGTLIWNGASGLIGLKDVSGVSNQVTLTGANGTLGGLRSGSRAVSVDAKSLSFSDPNLGDFSGSLVRARGTLDASFMPTSASISGTILNASRRGLGTLQANGVDIVFGSPNQRENNRLSLSVKAQTLSGTVKGRSLTGGSIDASVEGIRESNGFIPRLVRANAGRFASSFTIGSHTQAFDAKGLTVSASEFGREQGGAPANVSLAISNVELGAGQASLLRGRADDIAFEGADFGTNAARATGRIGAFTSSVSGASAGLASGNRLQFSATQIGSHSARIANLTADALKVVVRGTEVGTIGLSANGTIANNAFSGASIVADRVEVTHATQLPRPFLAQNLRAQGDFGARQVGLDGFSLRHSDVDLSGTAAITLAPRGSPRVDLIAEIDGSFSVETLLSAWPRRFLPDTRGSIARLVPFGTAQVSRLSLAIPSGMKPKEILPRSGIDLAFALKDVTVTYLPGMSAITNVSGEGVLTGNSLSIDLPTGAINDILLTNGKVEIAEFKERGAIVTIDAQVDGSVLDMAREIDLPPLALLSKAKLEADRLSGLATATLNLQIPLKPALQATDVGVTVSGDFKEAGLTSVFAGLDATAATGHLSVADNTVEISGKALYARSLFDFNWANIGLPSEEPQTTLRATGNVDIANLAAIGLDLGTYASGPIGLNVQSNSQGSAFGAAIINADFFNTNIKLPGDLWRKNEAVAAIASANLYPREGGGWNVQDLRFDSFGARLRGALDLSNDAKLVDARFSRVVIDNAVDLAVNVTPADTGLTVTLRGEYLNLSPFLKTQNVSEKAVDLFDRPLDLSADIKRVSTSDDNALTNVHADVLRDLQGWRTLSATGDSAAGSSQIRLMVERDGRRSVSGILSDAGLFAELLYPGAPIVGGSGVIEGELPVVGANSSGILTFTGKNITLARTGATPILFENVAMPMSVRGGVVTLRDGQADGDAYTVKASGYVDVGGGRLDVRGVATPGGLNRVLADIPLFGAILGGGADEGLLGVTFAAKGTLTSPRISVNPVSALAPGFLRKLFESEAPLSPQPRLVVTTLAGDPIVTKWPYGPTEDMTERASTNVNEESSGPAQ